MPGMMPGMPMPGAPMMQMATSVAQVAAAALAGHPPHVRKQMLGERLYPLVCRLEPQLSGKITGMLLEMQDSEVIILFESEPTLRTKVSEAVKVLNRTAPMGAVPPAK
mmetsp:Transcript_2325/g.6608  ORF Transcript_2325/g.6608 Transcript_2325/m.6608 type:complete len:108 (+) Transcript_2325:1-324(+)